MFLLLNKNQYVLPGERSGAKTSHSSLNKAFTEEIKTSIQASNDFSFIDLWPVVDVRQSDQLHKTFFLHAWLPLVILDQREILQPACL